MSRQPDAKDEYIRKLRLEEAMRLLQAASSILDQLGVRHEIKIDKKALKG
jgi:hypothetical protein